MHANIDIPPLSSGEHGLTEILLALRMSRVAEVRELLTGLLWNLSSCEVRKTPLKSICIYLVPGSKMHIIDKT